MIQIKVVSPEGELETVLNDSAVRINEKLVRDGRVFWRGVQVGYVTFGTVMIYGVEGRRHSVYNKKSEKTGCFYKQLAESEGFALLLQNSDAVCLVQIPQNELTDVQLDPK